MSRIDDLINNLCPDGVEYRALSEVGTFVRGGGLQKVDFVESGFPCIHYGQIYTFYGLFTYETTSFVSNETALKLKKAPSGSLVITTTSENVQDVCKSTAWLGDGEIVIGGHSCVFIHEMDPKFVAYVFRTSSFQDQKNLSVQGTKVKDISLTKLEKIRIPVPLIEVQREIVSILDKFTELEAELEAELIARRKQYEHYRNQLLTFSTLEEGGVRWVPMSEVFLLAAGNFIAASEISQVKTTEKPFACFGANGLRGYVAHSNRSGNLLAIGRQGALCGNVTRTTGQFYATEHAVIVEPIIEVDMNWAFHALTHMNLNQYATKSAQPGLSVKNLLELRIPLPNHVDQTTIGSALSSLDSIVSDFNSGLPAEIAARRKQYEYYRDKLLTFKELEVA